MGFQSDISAEGGVSRIYVQFEQQAYDGGAGCSHRLAAFDWYRGAGRCSTVSEGGDLCKEKKTVRLTLYLDDRLLEFGHIYYNARICTRKFSEVEISKGLKGISETLKK